MREGIDRNQQPLAKRKGILTAINSVVSSGQSMRLYFSSNSSSISNGLDLTVTVSDLTVTGTITLADNASNVTAIYINNGKKVVIK